MVRKIQSKWKEKSTLEASKLRAYIPPICVELSIRVPRTVKYTTSRERERDVELSIRVPRTVKYTTSRAREREREISLIIFQDSFREVIFVLIWVPGF
jgi:hypothetical protein